MNDWRLSAKTETYKNALKATESIDQPAEGFVKPTEPNNRVTITLIKQNNTIIQLLVRLSEDFEQSLETLKDIKRAVTDTSANTSSSVSAKAIEDLEKSLQRLNLGESTPKQKPKPAPFYVFKDPLKILEEEKKKAAK